MVFDPNAVCPSPVPPVLEIPHENWTCAVIGGVVDRDPRIPSLVGRFLYGDLCTGKITAAAIENERVTATDDLGLSVPSLSSFGLDAVGRVYVTSDAGPVYRLDPAPR